MLFSVSLSDNTIKRLIEEMSDDIDDQILAEISSVAMGGACASPPLAYKSMQNRTFLVK